jgi:hypothetical protein
MNRIKHVYPMDHAKRQTTGKSVQSIMSHPVVSYFKLLKYKLGHQTGYNSRFSSLLMSIECALDTRKTTQEVCAACKSFEGPTEIFRRCLCHATYRGRAKSSHSASKSFITKWMHNESRHGLAEVDNGFQKVGVASGGFSCHNSYNRE